MAESKQRNRMKKQLLKERFQKLANIKPLYESNGALSSQVEDWLIEEIEAHDATDTGINGEFELGITNRYYGHDPIAVKLMREMEKLGEIFINIKTDGIGDVKISSVESDYVVAKWGKYVDDDDDWIEA